MTCYYPFSKLLTWAYGIWKGSGKICIISISYFDLLEWYFGHIFSPTTFVFFFVTILFGTDLVHVYIGSMHGIFPYIYHKNQPNVGKYITHGSNGYMHKSNLPFSFAGFVPAPKKKPAIFCFFQSNMTGLCGGHQLVCQEGPVAIGV